MEKRTALVQQNNALIQTGQPSLTLSQKSLAREIDLTATNSKFTLTEQLTDELFRLYSRRTPEAIEWVFREHRARSSFWPSIAELNSLFGEYYNAEREKETESYMHSLRETRARLKADGLPYGEAQVVELRRQLLHIVQSMDEAAKQPRVSNLRNQVKEQLKRTRTAKRKQK